MGGLIEKYEKFEKQSANRAFQKWKRCLQQEKDGGQALGVLDQHISDYKRLNKIVEDNKNLINEYENEEEKLLSKVKNLKKGKAKGRVSSTHQSEDLSQLEEHLSTLQMRNREMGEKFEHIEFNVSNFVKDMNSILSHHEAGSTALDFSEDLELDSGGGSTIEDQSVAIPSNHRRTTSQRKANAAYSHPSKARKNKYR